MFSVSGYLYQQENLYTLSVYIPMAIYTSIGFFIFSLALLFSSPATGLMKIVSGPHSGSRLVRLMLPIAVLLPVLLSALFKVSGLFTVSMGELLNTTFLMLVLVMAILFISHRLNKESILTIEANARLSNFNIELEREIEIRTAELIIANNEIAVQYEASRHLASIVESSDDAIISTSLDGTIESWNHAAEIIFGYTAEEAIAEPVSLIIPPGYSADENIIPDKNQNDDMGHHFETVRMKKSGEQFHVSLTVSPIRDNERKITGVSIIVRDITRKKEMAEELNKQISIVNALLANLQIGVYMVEVPSGIPLLANESSFNLLGRGILPEANSNTIAKVYDLYKTGTDIPYPNEELPLILAMSGVSKHVDDMEVKKPDGTRIALEVFGSPIRDNSGNIWASLVSFQDITERKQAEQALKKSEDFLIRTGEIARVGGWEMDLDQNKAIWTRTAADIHELPGTSEIDLDKAFSFFHSDDIKAVRNCANAAIKSGESFEFEARIVTAKGKVRWIRSIGAPVLVSGKCHFVSGIVQDITERKQAEDTLLKLTKQLEHIGEMAKIGGWELDIATTQVTYSRETARIHEVGFPYVPPKLSQGNEYYPPDVWPDVQTAVQGAIENGTAYDREWPFITAKGKHIWVRAQGFAVRENGKTIQLRGTFQDITERKQAEEKLKKTVQDLELSNKDLEQFAYVANHDLQEPLRMISSYTQLLERKYKDKLDQDANDYIQFAVNGAIRMQKLLSDLLEFSKINSYTKMTEHFGVSIPLGQAVSNLHQLIAENTALITNDDLPVITADEAQIMRLFQNLIENAIKFKKKTELPKIHISCTRQNNMYQFSVADNGIGMEMHYHDRVFIVFQRLHSVKEYPGTGIGLSICKRIVERHGGNIWFESTVNEGTTFYFTIPVKTSTL